MCGRFVRRQEPAVYAAMFEIEAVPAGPSYNVAPSQPVAAVRMHGSRREGVLLRWGLVPSWSKDGKAVAINARAETVADKPAFRAAFQKRRCLVLADGYYEWKAEGKVRRPFYFSRQDAQPFAFAGIWEGWRGPAGSTETCAIITADANERTRSVHDRMPVMLTPEGAALWIDPEIDDARVLQGLLVPFPADLMAFHEVNRTVNSPKNDRPELILPVPG